MYCKGNEKRYDVALFYFEHIFVGLFRPILTCTAL